MIAKYGFLHIVHKLLENVDSLYIFHFLGLKMEPILAKKKGKMWIYNI